MFLSWVIPMYNCERYIARCIDSLLSQGLEPNEYEIVVIDDGSTDAGAEIVSRYCHNHANISMIAQSNQGLGPARNKGIELAKGDYIHFVDADDYLYGRSILTIRDYLKSTTDRPSPELCRVDYTIVYDGSKLEAEFKYCTYYTQLIELVTQIGIHPSASLWLYAKGFIERNDLRFIKIIGEDQPFMLEVLRHPEANVLRCQGPCYVYYQRSGSLMSATSNEKYRQRINDFIAIYQMAMEYNHLDQYPKEVIDDFVLTYLKCAIATNLLASRLPTSEIKALYGRAKELGILPLDSKKNTLVKILDLATKSWQSTVLASFPYKYIYAPLIKSRRR